MPKQEICRIAGGMLLVLIGFAIGFGSFQLWNGVPATWTNVIATDPTARHIARSMLAASAVLLIAGIVAMINLKWGYLAAVFACAVFIAGGFWANNVLYGSMRPWHMVLNVVDCVLILWLLWIGYSVPKN